MGNIQHLQPRSHTEKEMSSIRAKHGRRPNCHNLSGVETFSRRASTHTLQGAAEIADLQVLTSSQMLRDRSTDEAHEHQRGSQENETLATMSAVTPTSEFTSHRVNNNRNIAKNLELSPLPKLFVEGKDVPAYDKI
jgi:hypothetical protein